MKEIREGFVAGIEGIARTAFGVNFVWDQGVNYFNSFAVKAGSFGFFRAVPDEQRIVVYHPTPQEIQKTLEVRPHIVVEHFQGLAVQQWHDFLGDLYRAAIREALEDPGSCDGQTAIRLRLNALATVPLPDAVADAARREFDFEESGEKLPRVAKLLRRTEALREPALAQAKKTIESNVLARNVLQHNGGVVRADDAKKNGGPFECDLGGSFVTVGIGQQLQRTVYDVARCVDAMTKVACALVP